MKKLIVLSGAPGSGKSYLSEMIRSQNNGHVYIISSDKLRLLITGDQQDLSQDKTMWKIFYDLPRIYANDNEAIVILDATNTMDTYRIASAKDSKPYFDETNLVVISLPKDVVSKQNLARECPVPDYVLDRLYDGFQMPTDNDKNFFNHIFYINDLNFQKTVDLILKKD